MASSREFARLPIAMAVAGLLLAAAGCSSPDRPPERGVVVDLIDQDWRSVPGVVADDGGLRVSATGRGIVAQDVGGGQPDPPVNLMGTHLRAEGDVELSVSFSDVTADATLAVYDRPPVIADEFRIEPAGVRLTLDEGDLQVAISDGTPGQTVTDPQPVHVEHVPVSEPGEPITIRRSGDLLEIALGGETVSSSSMGSVFTSGELWLGLSSDVGSFSVDSFTAEAPAGVVLAAAGPAATSAAPSPDGVQSLAEHIRPGFVIGAAVALGPLASDPDYANEFIGEFGALTPENAMKPQALSPRRGEYIFDEVDALLELAESKGIVVHGHTIAFTEAMPRWMRELPVDSETERSSSAEALLDYVTTVVTHVRGRLHSLDVVNEPFDVDQGTDLQENIWYRVFGPDYPVVVSQAVHDADPDVRQFINENGADVPGPRQDALLRLALEINERGGHIDGVGLQSHVYHLDTDAISADDLEETLDTFGDAGLAVRISENDVTDGEGSQAQAEQYATVLAGCLRSAACVSYTTWGVDDRYDWWVDDDGEAQQAHDFLFSEGEPTPAYSALRRVLAEAEGQEAADADGERIFRIR